MVASSVLCKMSRSVCSRNVPGDDDVCVLQVLEIEKPHDDFFFFLLSTIDLFYLKCRSLPSQCLKTDQQYTPYMHAFCEI